MTERDVSICGYKEKVFFSEPYCTFGGTYTECGEKIFLHPCSWKVLTGSCPRGFRKKEFTRKKGCVSHSDAGKEREKILKKLEKNLREYEDVRFVDVMCEIDTLRKGEP